MMYFSSDLHLFHENSIKFSKTRSALGLTNTDEMHHQIIEAWNRRVTPRDEGYILGDLSFGRFGPTMEIMKKLNGHIHLILGNHDHKHSSGYKSQRRFSSVSRYKEIKWENNLFVLSHYPMAAWNKDRWGSFHLHGHMHGMKMPWYPPGRIMDVGIDTRADLSPWSIVEVFEKLSGNKSPKGAYEGNTD